MDRHRCAGGLAGGVLRMARSARKSAQGGQSRLAGRNLPGPCGASRPPWRAKNPRGPARRGHKASRGRAERLMRQHGIRAQTQRRFRVCSTDSNHDLPISTHRIYPMCPFCPQSARPQFCGRTAQSGLARRHRRMRQSSEASLRPRIYHARASRAKSRLSRGPLNRGKVKRLYLRLNDSGPLGTYTSIFSPAFAHS